MLGSMLQAYYNYGGHSLARLSTVPLRTLQLQRLPPSHRVAASQDTQLHSFSQQLKALWSESIMLQVRNSRSVCQLMPAFQSFHCVVPQAFAPDHRGSGKQRPSLPGYTRFELQSKSSLRFASYGTQASNTTPSMGRRTQSAVPFRVGWKCTFNSFVLSIVPGPSTLISSIIHKICCPALKTTSICSCMSEAAANSNPVPHTSSSKRSTLGLIRSSRSRRRLSGDGLLSHCCCRLLALQWVIEPL